MSYKKIIEEFDIAIMKTEKIIETKNIYNFCDFTKNGFTTILKIKRSCEMLKISQVS